MLKLFFARLKLKTKVLAVAAAPFFFLLALAAVTFFSVNKLTETNRWVNHTYEVLGEAAGILSSAVDMETGMRGFMLAGKEEFLEPYQAQEQEVYTRINALKNTVSDNPPQVERLGEAEKVLKVWQTEVAEQQIAFRRGVGEAVTMDDVAVLIGEARGKQYFDTFREHLSAFTQEEEQLIARRLASNEQTKRLAYFSVAGCLILGVLIGLAFTLSISGNIQKPVLQITEAMSVLAEGDTTVKIKGTDRVDEIGDIARATQVFRDNAVAMEELRAQQKEAERVQALEKEKAQQKAAEAQTATMNRLADEFEETVRRVVDSVSEAALQMQGNAGELSDIAERTNQQSLSVETATERAGSSVHMAASAAEELSASIAEINREIATTSEKAQEAALEASKSEKAVLSLQESVEQVNSVVALISSIAEQTNLLALNAAIEAASAGDAGRGFAVVADEVKSLAAQTAQATSGITEQIRDMQSRAKISIQSVQNINGMVEEISSRTTTVAIAVEQQGQAANEISENVTDAADRAGNATEDIRSLTQASSKTGEMSGEVLRAANNLGDQSKLLSKEVDAFILRVRKAS